mgnify:CR=1 FL=1
MIIYVDASVIQTGNGTKENPFKTIQEAAAKALPGDEVIVAPGLYREAVNPIHAGTADKRITYRSAIKGQAHITGSEAVKDWENVEGTVWKAVIPNGIFGDYNPFTTLVSGDWFIATFIAHTGDVYLNEKSMYENMFNMDSLLDFLANNSNFNELLNINHNVVGNFDITYLRE